MSAVARAQQRQSAPNGLWGMVLFLCAEICLFGCMIGTYFYLNFNSHQWPPPGIKPEPIASPSIATGWLLLTLIPMWIASRQVMRGERWWAFRWIVFGLALQCGYLAFQITLYISDWHHFHPQGTAYGSIYYTLMTADHAHVAFGLLLDVVIAGKLITKGLTNYWLVAVRCLAFYWYVVGGVTLFVLLTQLAPSL